MAGLGKGESHAQVMGDRFGEILRFGVVGLIATATHFLVLWLSIEMAGAPKALANGLAFLVALSVTYLGQSRWVFRAARRNATRALRFIVTAVGGFIANVVIMAFAIGPLGWSYRAGFVAAVCIVPALSYLASRHWVFRNEVPNGPPLAK